jgi:HAD superfamily hydrolase (TIGR01509 family)
VSDIRHIVFDLGNVLIRWDAEIPYRRLIPDAAARKHFLTNICSHDWNLEQDRGRTWREAENMLIAQHPEHAEMIRAFRGNWEEMIHGTVEESVAILKGLAKAGIDLTALTNWSAETFPWARENFPLLQHFRGITVSGEVRLVKPDIAIYRHHAQAFGLTPEKTLFFDDNAANVEGARKAGWNAELFTDPAGMRRDLARHGIAVA